MYSYFHLSRAMISFVAIYFSFQCWSKPCTTPSSSCTIATSRIKHEYFVTNPLYFHPQKKEGEIFGNFFLGNVLAHINIGFNYKANFHCIFIKTCWFNKIKANIFRVLGQDLGTTKKTLMSEFFDVILYFLDLNWGETLNFQ